MNQQQRDELEANKEEMQKCKDDPVYFYNKYVRAEGQKELTKEEFEILAAGTRVRRRGPDSVMLRKAFKAEYHMTPDECFESPIITRELSIDEVIEQYGCGLSEKQIEKLKNK